MNAENWILKKELESPCQVILGVSAGNREEGTEGYWACKPS